MLASAFHIPDMTHPDYPPLVTLAKILTGGKSAVLKERLLHTSRVTSIMADAFVGKDCGTFEFFAQIADGVEFAEVEAVVRQALEECARGEISRDQLTIVKNEIERELYQSATNPDSLGQKLGDGFINTGDLAFGVKILDAFGRVDIPQIGAAARRYLLDQPGTAIRLHPEPA
jgi:predicted Zn-dependent peptidase